MIAFGPVPSRRLGKSLGINNIITYKVCTYNCVYCQLGDTSKKTMIRQSFYEPQTLLKDINQHLGRLDKKYRPDYLTFVANGEPALDINLGIEIGLLKKFGIPVAVITNASLIHEQLVQNDLMEADWVSVKVDSVDEGMWNKINRPLPGFHFQEILDGIRIFSAIYKGRLHTETMLISDYNDTAMNLKKTASFIAQLNPETAFLSIPTRPPALKEIYPAREQSLTEAWQIFEDAGIKTELLTGFEGTDVGFTGNPFEDILNITAVHPLRQDSIEDLIKKEGTNMDAVDSLVAEGLIRRITYDGQTYYVRRYHF